MKKEISWNNHLHDYMSYILGEHDHYESYPGNFDDVKKITNRVFQTDDIDVSFTHRNDRFGAMYLYMISFIEEKHSTDPSKNEIIVTLSIRDIGTKKEMAASVLRTTNRDMVLNAIYHIADYWIGYKIFDIVKIMIRGEQLYLGDIIKSYAPIISYGSISNILFNDNYHSIDITYMNEYTLETKFNIRKVSSDQERYNLEYEAPLDSNGKKIIYPGISKKDFDEIIRGLITMNGIGMISELNINPMGCA